MKADAPDEREDREGRDRIGISIGGQAKPMTVSERAAIREGIQRIIAAMKRTFRKPGTSRSPSTMPSSWGSIPKRLTMKLLNTVSCTPKKNPTPPTAIASNVKFRVHPSNNRPIHRIRVSLKWISNPPPALRSLMRGKASGRRRSPRRGSLARHRRPSGTGPSSSAPGNRC